MALSFSSLPARLPVRFYPLGDAAIVLEFGTSISEATHRSILAAAAYLDQHTFPGFIEYVPAFTTLTVYYDPWQTSEAGQLNPYESVAETLRRLLEQVPPAVTDAPAPVVEIPVCYGGAHGPDLQEVARHVGVTPAEVIKLHTQPTYLVYMLGFAPGFPYLGGMNQRLTTPRKTQPRALVPVGSVGIAGPQTGIYSLPTPGGWQLIGRTPQPLFTPATSPPSLLQAGQRLRFVAISEREYQQRQPHEL